MINEFSKKGFLFELNKLSYGVEDIVILDSGDNHLFYNIFKIKIEDFYIYCNLRLYKDVDSEDLLEVLISGLENFMVEFEMTRNEHIRIENFIKLQLELKFIFDNNELSVKRYKLDKLSSIMTYKYKYITPFLLDFDNIDLSILNLSNGPSNEGIS